MYKLTEYDKFEIESLIENVSVIIKYEGLKKLFYIRTDINIEDNIFEQSNYKISKLINWLLAELDKRKSLIKLSQNEINTYKYNKSLKEKLLSDEHLKINNDVYFSNERIEELKSIKNNKFDLSKLIRILEEVNICYKNECYFSVSSLLRMLIDHIPPIFWKNSFDSVIAEVSFWKSDKNNLWHLKWWLKNIADCNLHSLIWIKEVLPTKETISFIPDFDVLLKLIIKELNK